MAATSIEAPVLRNRIPEISSKIEEEHEARKRSFSRSRVRAIGLRILKRLSFV